jgi:ribosomal protein L4
VGIEENTTYAIDLQNRETRLAAHKAASQGSASGSNISQQTKNVNSDQHSLKDSEGNELTQAQAEYFKNSKMRDDGGNLKVMYRGDTETITVFDCKKSKPSNLYGRGFVERYTIFGGSFNYYIL